MVSPSKRTNENAQAPRASGPRKKLAIITTVWHYLSHAQHMGDRFLTGYPVRGKWHRPAMDVVSLYVDQKPKNDLSAERARRFPSMRLCPTIAEALTLGGSKLAVDGVVLVGEHGAYPRTPKGQVQYPRYRLWQEIVKVFKSSKKAVPVFNDKHLSWSWKEAKWMYEQSKDLGFPLMAGSSVPVTYRHPDLKPAAGTQWQKALAVGYGPFESYGFHTLEALQVMIENRKGGETGVKAVQALESRAAWAAGPTEPSIDSGSPTTRPPAPSLHAMATTSAALSRSLPRLIVP